MWSVRRLHGDFDELFGDLIERRGSGGVRRAPADVYVIEDPPALVIEIAVPGIDPADVDIELDGPVLTVRGERRRSERQRRIYHHAEIDWGQFERRIQLGVAVDGTTATARYETGLLIITLPLASRTRNQRVPIALKAPR